MQDYTEQEKAEYHGSLATTVVLESENTKNFLAILTAIEGHLQPRNCVEDILIAEFAVNLWRRTRTRHMEKALFDYEIGNFEALPGVTRPVTKAVLACRGAASQSGIFDLLARFENRYSRNLGASLRLLLQFRAARPAQVPKETL